jgi:hypothetical protein
MKKVGKGAILCVYTEYYEICINSVIQSSIHVIFLSSSWKYVLKDCGIKSSVFCTATIKSSAWIEVLPTCLCPITYAPLI